MQSESVLYCVVGQQVSYSAVGQQVLYCEWLAGSVLCTGPTGSHFEVRHQIQYSVICVGQHFVHSVVGQKVLYSVACQEVSLFHRKYWTQSGLAGSILCSEPVGSVF